MPLTNLAVEAVIGHSMEVVRNMMTTFEMLLKLSPEDYELFYSETKKSLLQISEPKMKIAAEANMMFLKRLQENSDIFKQLYDEYMNRIKPKNIITPNYGIPRGGTHN